MGVRHLYTFISKTVPNGTFEINMIEEVNKFKKENNEKPIIIVDLYSLHDKIYTNDHEKLIGGRYNVYNERVTSMLTKLQSLDAQIIYFYDGNPQIEKKKTCLKRREADYDDGIKLFNAIDDGLDLTKGLKNFRVLNLTPFLRNLIKIAKKIGELRKCELNECDQEIANLANNLQAMAVISHDTDFLIYGGNWRYWSGNDIDFQTMNTIEFNKSALRNLLSLSNRQMALFGTLGGNDIVQYETVEHYHRQIAPRGGKFYKIANEVRQIRSLPPRLSSFDENYIIKKVFQPHNRHEGLKNLRKSLNIYCYENMKKEFQDHDLEIISKNSTSFNLAILSVQEHFLNICYTDLNKNIFMPIYDMIRQIFRRVMGILLKNKKHLNPTNKIYCKLTHEKPYEEIIETPEYPSYEIPKPVILLCRPYGDDSDLDELRLKLFCWQISEKLNPDDILKLPKDNFNTIITIYYMIEKKQISIEEADCLLLACNCPPEIRDSLDLNEMKHIDGRDARLALLFPIIFCWIYKALCAVGLNDFSTMLAFDGLYFHNLRKQCKENNQNLTNLIDEYKHLRIYVQ